MAHVYRADTIGSLLRPPYLKLAREQFEAGQLEPAAYKEIEDRAVDQALAMQEGVGLDVVTDGELRRHTFIDQLTEQVLGLAPDSGDSGHIPVPFHDEAGQLKSVFTIPLSVTGTLQRRRMMTTEEYAYARARARRPVKVTLPSPLMLFLVWSPQRSRDAYPDPFEMFADGLRLMKEEAEELARMGCRYIQVDAPDFGQLVDPAQREAWEQAGISVDRVFSEGADMLNELAGVRRRLVRPPSVPGKLRQRLDQHRHLRDHLQAALPAGHQLRHVPAGVRRRAVGFVYRARRRPGRQDGGARAGLDQVRPDGAGRPAGRPDQRGERLLPAGTARDLDAVRVRLGRTGQPDQRGRPGEQAAPGRARSRTASGVRAADPAGRYGTYSRIRPRSRKPTAAYTRSAIWVDCRLAVRQPRSRASYAWAAVSAVPRPRRRAFSTVPTL